MNVAYMKDIIIQN